MATMQNTYHPEYFRVVHPLDDAPDAQTPGHHKLKVAICAVGRAWAATVSPLPASTIDPLALMTMLAMSVPPSKRWTRMPGACAARGSPG